MITKRILNKAIKAAGNQSLLALYMGFSRQMMSQIVNNKRPFPKDRIKRLMDLAASQRMT